MQEYLGRTVELSTPDGRCFHFFLGAVLDFEDALYAVLIEQEPDAQGEEQILITRWEVTSEGEQSFEVVADERIIQAIFERYAEERGEEE